jgi:putative membrane protein
VFLHCVRAPTHGRAPTTQFWFSDRQILRVAAGLRFAHTNRMKISTLILCAMFVGSATAGADTAKTTKLSDSEMHVLAHVHHVNQMEIDAGHLAQKKGTTQAVKSYGKMLVDDHTSNDKEIIAFAKKHGQKIGNEVAMNEADKQDEKDNKDAMARIKNMKGADFDREFLTTMAAGHDKELAKIDTAIGQVSDNDLATMLKDMKPVLQKHADQARELSKSNAQASMP